MKFTKEEDVAIINSYIQSGFTLTQKVCENLVQQFPERNVKSIRNRFYRTLAQYYKNFLNKDYHIRIALIANLTNGILKDHASEADTLAVIANKFHIPKKKFAKLYYNGTEVWSKTSLGIHYDEVPNTNLDMVNLYLKQEDSTLHLFDDLIETIENNECISKQETKLTLWQKIKKFFRCKK